MSLGTRIVRGVTAVACLLASACAGRDASIDEATGVSASAVGNGTTDSDNEFSAVGALTQIENAATNRNWAAPYTNDPAQLSSGARLLARHYLEAVRS